jgi:hypothetical protein
MQTALFTRAQATIDEISGRAKQKPAARSLNETLLTSNDVLILRVLYNSIGQGGRFVAPEAAQLMRRYLKTDLSGTEEIPATVYQNDTAVQKEILKHKAEIKLALRSGKLKRGGRIEFAIHASARTSQGCSHTGIKPPGKRLLRADSERLQKANNRFWLQSYSTADADQVTTRFLVTDCYEFEPFSRGFFTNLELYGQKIVLPDGLSEYLTRIGLAKVFTYESSWVEGWKFPESKP